MSVQNNELNKNRYTETNDNHFITDRFESGQKEHTRKQYISKRKYFIRTNVNFKLYMVNIIKQNNCFE